MKKEILLIGVLVAMSMGVMFTACKKENSGEPEGTSGSEVPQNGCVCNVEGNDENFAITKKEMKEYYGGATTCDQVVAFNNAYGEKDGALSCIPY